MMRLLGTLAVLGLFSSYNCCDQRRCDPHRCEPHRCEPGWERNSCDLRGSHRGNWNNRNRRW